MLTPYSAKNKNSFIWESIGSIVDGRRNLGEDMPVFAYRLFQFSIKYQLAKRYGNDTTVEIFRSAGELAGKEFANKLLNFNLPFNKFFSHIQTAMEESKIGILRIENFDFDAGEGVFTVAEDLDCSGLPVTDENVCYYDEGFIAGILKAYTKKDYVVTEIDCWATGSKMCRFKATVKTCD